MRLTLLLFLCLSVSTVSHGDAKTIAAAKASDEKNVYPVPPLKNESLFYVQRTSNTNTIMYDLNIGADGKINAEEPVKTYWIRYAEDGQKKDLSYIQRKFAYGLTSKPLNNGNYDIRFVSYKKFPLTLMKAADGKYHIFAVIAQKQVIINRIFVKIEGGTFWLPNVTSVEVKGSDPITGREIVEHFKP
ncbi:MAG TPA: DUF4833 domain-containing protein [Mucilaginibacter sp.]|jgi:hypothetical protein